MKPTVLSFAVVRLHGREWLMLAIVFVLSALCVRSSAFQSSEPLNPVAVDLAARIIGVLGTSEPVNVTIESGTTDDRRAAADVPRALAARGMRIITDDAVVPVRVSCQSSLVEHTCVGQLRRGESLQVLIATRPLAGDAAPPPPVLALDLHPLIAQRDPILDVATVSDRGDRLLVLGPRAITLTGGADAPASRPIVSERVLPRDLRGRLQVSGMRFQAFLPGVVCRGTLDPFTAACADESEPWPIGIDNVGMTVGRNSFLTPEGLNVFSVAALEGRSFVVVDTTGVLALLDRSRRVVLRGTAADDVAALGRTCAAGNFVVAAGGDGERGTLTLLRVGEQTLAAAAPPLALPGAVTALWSGDTGATVIVGDRTTDRYEAFRLVLSCVR